MLTRSWDKSLAPNGKLSPAVLPGLLVSDRWRACAMAICALFHTSADLADDVADGDLAPGWTSDGPGQALNTSHGLLFFQQRCIQRLDVPAFVRQGILTLFAEAGWRMHEGQRLDLASTNRLQTTDYRLVAELKTGSEIAAFLETAAWLEGRDPEPFWEYGEALGALLQIFSDYADVWLTALSPDLMAGKLTAPLQAGLRDLGDDFLLQLAGTRRNPLQQKRVRQRLLALPMAEALAADWGLYRQRWLFARRSEPILERLDGVCQWMEEGVESLIEALASLQAQSDKLPALAPQPPGPEPEKQAIAFLKADPMLKESWEIHRWGLLGRDHLAGNLYQLPLIGEILHEVGEEVTPIWHALIENRSEDGWHYYPHEPLIPPDADDLGQVLQFAAALGLESGEREKWLRGPIFNLLANIEPDGRVHTWLADGDRYRHEELIWPGDECEAVMGNAYYGLWLIDGERHAALFDQGARFLLKRFQAPFGWESFYYTPVYNAFVITRFLAAWGDATLDVRLKSEIEACLAEVTRYWRGLQRLDGGWGTPQQTAIALDLLMMRGALSATDVKRGCLYLADHQWPDGGWPAEKFFVCPGKHGEEAWLTTRLITSALCLRALHRGNRYLSRRRGTQPL